MAGRTLRGAIVGASSLLGKELAEVLERATSVAWDLSLLDTDEAGGQITAAGDEAMVILPINAESFAGIDFAFFASDAATTLKFWRSAHASGASIVDLTGALEGQANVIVRSPLVQSDSAIPQLATEAVVSAHPVAIILAGVSAALRPLGLLQIAATILLPASELGREGVDEVHQQTVALLSFKPLHKEIFDAPVAFNLSASLGDSSKLDLLTLTARIHRQIRTLQHDKSANAISMQLVQAPVFHGHTGSIFVELNSGVDEASIRKALSGGPLKLQEEPSPSNDSVAGNNEVQIRLTPASSQQGNAVWLWLAADNLRLAARNAAACAEEQSRLRPMRGIH